MTPGKRDVSSRRGYSVSMLYLLFWEIGGEVDGAVAASSTGYTGYCPANRVAVALWGGGARLHRPCYVQVVGY